MKRTQFFRKGNTLKNNNRRRLMLKRVHQKMLHRRRVFFNGDLLTPYAKAS